MADSVSLDVRLKMIKDILGDSDQVLTYDYTYTKNLTNDQRTKQTLSSDAAAAVSFGSVTNARLIVLRILNNGQKVIARLTSADGSAQIVPFNDLLVLVSISTPITAITLQRTTGVSTVVGIALAE